MANGTCSEPDCEKPAWSRQLCSSHYQRRRKSDPDFVLQKWGQRRIWDVDVESRTCECPVHGAGSRLRVRTTKTGASSYSCRPCDRGPGWRGETKGGRLRRKYGMTLEEYDLRAQAQQGACLICGSQDSPLVVDHCHEREHVRGLLCSRCNVGLGMFLDNPASLTRAARYLKAYKRAIG